MAILKFALRRNLIYPVQHILWCFARQLLTIYMNSHFDFSSSLIFTPLMFLGELFGGTIFYFYQKTVMREKKKEEKDQYFMSIKLVKKQEDNDYEPVDDNIKILSLIFLAAFFDQVEFLLSATYIPKFVKLSGSFSSRLGGISTLFVLLFYLYALKLPIFKHHKFSLIIISICLIIIIASEYFYQEINIFLTYAEFTLALGFIIIINMLLALMDSTEKYLYEYDYMNPFIVLMYEGLFGFALTFLFFFVPGYLDDIGVIYKKKTSGEFALFIFLLFLYVLFSGGKNLFRVVTIKIYSPLTKSLTDYFLNPIYMIYHCGALNDFFSDGKMNIPYFTINLILSLVISFFGCVYSEFIIIYLFGLEKDTFHQISKRAKLNVTTELAFVNGDDSDSEDSESSI